MSRFVIVFAVLIGCFLFASLKAAQASFLFVPSEGGWSQQPEEQGVQPLPPLEPYEDIIMPSPQTSPAPQPLQAEPYEAIVMPSKIDLKASRSLPPDGPSPLILLPMWDENPPETASEKDVFADEPFEDVIQAVAAGPVVEPPPISPPAPPRKPGKWNAEKGELLKAVLERWSTKSDVAFTWEYDRALLVLGPVRSDDSFELAVSELLDQYIDRRLRPVGTLYVDPVSERKLLKVMKP